MRSKSVRTAALVALILALGATALGAPREGGIKDLRNSAMNVPVSPDSMASQQLAYQLENDVVVTTANGVQTSGKVKAIDSTSITVAMVWGLTVIQRADIDSVEVHYNKRFSPVGIMAIGCGAALVAAGSAVQKNDQDWVDFSGPERVTLIALGIVAVASGIGHLSETENVTLSDDQYWERMFHKSQAESGSTGALRWSFSF